MTEAAKTYLPIYQTVRKGPNDVVFRVIAEIKDGKRDKLHMWVSDGPTALGEEMWRPLAPHQVPWALVEQWTDQMIPHLLANVAPAPETNGQITNRVAEVA